MVRTTGKSPEGYQRTLQPASVEYEAMLGSIVIEMLRAGKPVNRASLCAKVAFMMSESPQLSQEIVYQELLRQLLNANR